MEAMLTSELLGMICSHIDASPVLAGAGVAYLDGRSSRVMRSPRRTPAPDLWVILEEEDLAARMSATPGPVPRPTAVPESKLTAKLKDTGLNCTGAVLAGIAAVAGTAAAPVTGGASGIITAVAGAAALASAAQCGISIGQAAIEFQDPGVNDRYLDNEEWFQSAGTFLDAVQLLGIAGSVGPSFKSITKILGMQRSTGRNCVQLVRGLNRAERKLLAKDLSGYGKSLSRKQWLTLARAGAIPKIYRQSAITATVVEQLVTQIGNGLSIYASRRSGILRTRGFVITIAQAGEP